MSHLLENLFKVFFEGLPLTSGILAYIMFCNKVITEKRKEDPNLKPIRIGWDWLDRSVRTYTNSPDGEKKEQVFKQFYYECVNLRNEDGSTRNFSRDRGEAEKKAEFYYERFKEFEKEKE